MGLFVLVLTLTFHLRLCAAEEVGTAKNMGSGQFKEGREVVAEVSYETPSHPESPGLAGSLTVVWPPVSPWAQPPKCS